MTNYQHIAEQMYAAYCQQAGGLTFDGKPLPSFQELGLERQTCWKAAAEAAHWREEAERDREEEAKRENAERLTSQLEKHLEQNEWDAQVPHPQCESQQIEVRTLLAEWCEDVLENNIAIAQALIEAGAGNINGIMELLSAFTSWYEEECLA